MNPSEDKKPVLFTFSVQNNWAAGMSLDNEAYTAFPSEREILLNEAEYLFIIACERDV